jgi:hypothetical protein
VDAGEEAGIEAVEAGRSEGALDPVESTFDPDAPFVGHVTLGEIIFAVPLGSDDGVHFRRHLLAEVADVSLVGSVGFWILGAQR